MADPVRVAALASPMIRKAERLMLDAYPDPASPLGVWRRANRGKPDPVPLLSPEPVTIGYGQTKPGVLKLGDRCTEAEAEAMLQAVVLPLAYRVVAMLRVPLPDAAVAPIVDFAYNLGADRLKSSTLLRLVNLKQNDEASREFGKWIRAKGVVLAGLEDRRRDERDAFRAAVGLPPVTEADSIG